MALIHKRIRLAEKSCMYQGQRDIPFQSLHLVPWIKGLSHFDYASWQNRKLLLRICSGIRSLLFCIRDLFALLSPLQSVHEPWPLTFSLTALVKLFGGCGIEFKLVDNWVLAAFDLLPLFACFHPEIIKNLI